MDQKIKKQAVSVLIIRPSMVVSKGTISSRPLALFLPLGVAYLAAYLQERGHEVSVIDAFGESPDKVTAYSDFNVVGLVNEEIIERIPERVDVIGISCMYSNDWPYVRELMSRIKKARPKIILVIGGEHPRAMPEYVFEDCAALDYLIYGEGEEAFYQLLQCLDRRELPQLIPGVIRRTDSGISEIIPAKRIKDLDELPLPAWDLFPVENFLSRGLCHLPKQGRRVLPVNTSRGCPYGCKFCTASGMWGNQYHQRSPEKVIAEMKFFKEKYSLTGFDISDLTFMTNRRWVMRFCELLICEKLGVDWYVVSTRAEVVDDDLAVILKKSGCVFVALTPDSGSKKQIQEMGKKVDLDQIEKAAKALLKQGITVRLNLVFAFPNEQHWDILQTIFYGLKMAWIGVQGVFFIRFVPYPGSEYFDLCKARNQIPPKGPLFDDFLVNNVTGEFTEVYSYTSGVSDRAVKAYIFLGMALSQLLFLVRHPLTWVKTLWKCCTNQSDEHVAHTAVAIFRRLGASQTKKQVKRCSRSLC